MKIRYITRDEHIRELISQLESEKRYLDVAPDEEYVESYVISKIQSIEKELLKYGVTA